MSEEFKNYLSDHLVIGGCGIGTNQVKNEQKEETEVGFDNASAPTSDDNFVFPDDLEKAEPSTEEPKEEPKPTEEEPKLKTSDNGTYHGIFLAPINHKQRITDALTKMAETDEELANAIREGKKTFDGCDRYIRNNMADLAREMHSKEIVFDDDSVHLIARYYMVNPDVTDVKQAVAEVAKTKAEPKKKETKPKKESKPKAEPKKETKKETKKAEVLDMFAGFEF